MQTDALIVGLERRVAKLEKAVFGRGSTAVSERAVATNYSGPTGAVRFLISKDYFKQKRSLGDVKTEATKNDYVYSRQAFDMALKRLSAKGALLVALTERGKKFYAKRK